MRDIKVVVTAAGCPGASTFLRMLRDKVKERKIELIAIDMDPEPIGRFIAHKFYQAPPAHDKEYIPFIFELIKKENPDIFFCVSSYEVPIVSKHREDIEALGTKVIVSTFDAIEIAGNKYKLYSILQHSEHVKIPCFYNPKNLDEFIHFAEQLGFPEKRVCFKPHFSKGSRGYRVLDNSISRKDLLLHYKPDSTFMSMDEFISIFKKEPEFPDLLLMEFIEGEEIDAMTLSLNGEALLVTCKTREVSRAGVIMKGELVYRPQIERACNEIIKMIPLDYNSGMQFKGGYLIEINTRVSTFIYQDDMIEPYISIKLALGEITCAEVKEYKKKIQYGRRFIRYMDQVFWNKNEIEDQQTKRLL